MGPSNWKTYSIFRPTLGLGGATQKKRPRFSSGLCNTLPTILPPISLPDQSFLSPAAYSVVWSVLWSELISLDPQPVISEPESLNPNCPSLSKNTWSPFSLWDLMNGLTPLALYATTASVLFLNRKLYSLFLLLCNTCGFFFCWGVGDWYPCMGFFWAFIWNITA